MFGTMLRILIEEAMEARRIVTPAASGNSKSNEKVGRKEKRKTIKVHVEPFSSPYNDHMHLTCIGCI